ncbi:MoaD/ThiS family protein [uncultured Nitrospira sp.]|uniref:MoaD/ThiS family protein n=1 Tax=uncultured Nitrospira sp. TaxID=157176 RepID=UPI0031401AA1
MVKVLIFGLLLREAVEDPEVEISLESPITIGQLLEDFPDHFQGLMPFLHANELMVTINQKISTLEAKVKNGDILKITHQRGDQSTDGAMWHNA